MAISYITSANGTNTVTMPSHQIGDLIIAFSFRDGSTTAPTLPTGVNWVDVGTRTGTSCSSRLAYKIATTTSETSGTFTNATSIIVAIYRNASGVGGSSSQAGAIATTTFPAITMTNSTGTSWIAGFIGHSSIDTDIEIPVTGFTTRNNVVGTTDEAASFDTNSGVLSWNAVSRTASGTVSEWNTWNIEIIPKPTYTVTYSNLDSTSGSVPVDSNEYFAGATVTVLGNSGNLSRVGYAFAGWSPTQT